MTYYYKRTEPRLWTVGSGEGDGWCPDSDHDDQEKAAARVHYLNGGTQAIAAFREVEALVEAARKMERYYPAGLGSDDLRAALEPFA